VPGCGDRDGSYAIVSTPPALNSPKCDSKKSLSGVPFYIFNGAQGNIYKTFCSAADGNQRQLNWNVDAFGVLQSTFISVSKRTPQQNASPYKDYKFTLSWKPNANYNRSSCIQTCADAFIAIADSPCGHQGGEY
jgi:hypothetical protein